MTAAALAALLRSWAGRAATRRARRRAQAARRDALRRLDSRTLRDLGLDASELGSCAAECCGIAEATRRRIAASGPPTYG